jgi:anaerobic magnesium-protoporphyrin IX monomethyl ester cyclase
MAWIALVGPEIEENLSLRYLASALAQAGYESGIIPYIGEHEFEATLSAIVDVPEAPMIVGLSLAFQWKATDTLALAVALRERGYRGHITAGGHFATFACAELLRDFHELDSIVRQEGEHTLVSLASAVQGGRPLGDIPGLAFRADSRVVHTGLPALPDLAALPFPDRRGEPAACFDHPIAPIVSSRGCYANCTFCCLAAWHEQTLPGKRYRVRDADDVAAEMAEMQRNRGIEVFVFHDDNFFVPGKRRNLERFHALADALERHGVKRFATVVKARPTDVDREVFTVLRDRLQAIRVYVGIETDSEQGLKTLRRWVRPRQNHAAIEIVRELGLYCCFNMLAFDPDTTLETLQINLDFMHEACDFPFNFGRVELYAGTPLLARMQQEGRARGDYLQWDYDLHDPEIARMFRLTMRAFRERNFGADALNNRIMGTRFDVEVSRHFHPDRYDPRWLAEATALTRALGQDTVLALASILAHVCERAPQGRDAELVERLSSAMRATEARIGTALCDLATRITHALGRGRPLTDIGDRVATPLQQPGAFAAAGGAA